MDESNEDTEKLFRIGKEAYKRLDFASEHDIPARYKEIYYPLIEEFRTKISNQRKEAWLTLYLLWKLRRTFNKETQERVLENTIWNLLLLHTLIEIDDALIAYLLELPGAVRSAIEASEALFKALTIESEQDAIKDSRQDSARKAALRKITRDPRQAEKQFIRECWNKWRKSPESYPSKAAFARDMLDKCVHLRSSKKIEDWCREWEKEFQESESC